MRLAGAGCPLIGLVAFEHSSTVAAATINVTIQNFTFLGPDGVDGNFTIAVGTSVTSTNIRPFAHTATSDTPAPPAPPLFDTGAIAGGTPSTPIIFSQAGTFPYHCQIHPFIQTMHGTITVVAPTALPGVKPSNPLPGNPNPLPDVIPSAAPAGGPPNAIPPRRSLANTSSTNSTSGGASGPTNTGAPAPAPLPPRR